MYKVDIFAREISKFKSFDLVRDIRPLRNFILSILFILSGIICGLIFAPWIQTAPGTGRVTTLDPQDRKQTITALVEGRIQKWYVDEGDFVEKGDLILEIVDNDPDIVTRLNQKKNAFGFSYKAKEIAAETAKINYERQKNLFRQDLASRLDVEKAKINYKKLLAEREEAEVKLQEAQSQVVRQNTQKIYAPTSGNVVQILSGGLATSVKAGDTVATLIPTNVPFAVEIFMRGLDIAITEPDRKVRLEFEGWPAVQFSGWPSVAYGTFGGIVHSVDPAVSENGLFRVIVKPDPSDIPWPSDRFLRYGARVKGWVLLEKVPLWYELWRQVNGFPPQYPLEMQKQTVSSVIK